LLLEARLCFAARQFLTLCDDFEVVSEIMTPVTYDRLIEFLKEELSLPDSSIAIAQRYTEQDPGPLPMILWQYGLVTLEQLDRIYDWLETA
jgi:hypothetical protein